MVVYIDCLSNHNCYYCECHYCCHHNLFPFSIFVEPSHFRSPVLHVILLQSLLPETFHLLYLRFLIFFIYIRLLISHTQDLLFHLYECKGNAFFLNSGNKWVTKWWKKAIFWYKSNTGSQPLDAGQLLSVSYFTYFRISLLFLPFLAGSGINPSVSPVLSVIAWNTEAA